MVICIIRLHKKKGTKEKKRIRPEKKRDMHAHIGVNTVQSVCVNKGEESDRERERARRRKRKIMIVVAHIGVLIYASETSYIYTD
jgi:membrane-anchored glycerophosphoryl diester phosphodiesterase (GDPDase)